MVVNTGALLWAKPASAVVAKATDNSIFNGVIITVNFMSFKYDFIKMCTIGRCVIHYICLSLHPETCLLAVNCSARTSSLGCAHLRGVLTKANSPPAWISKCEYAARNWLYDVPARTNAPVRSLILHLLKVSFRNLFPEAQRQSVSHLLSATYILWSGLRWICD